MESLGQQLQTWLLLKLAWKQRASNLSAAPAMVRASASTALPLRKRLDLLNDFAAVANQLAGVPLKRVFLRRIEPELERILVAGWRP